ncbi:MAG: hypothetical protein ACJAR1_001655 [Rubritalea sp.]|jgi:hypothetical protein
MNSDGFGVVPPRAASCRLVVPRGYGRGLIQLTDKEKTFTPFVGW